MMENQNKIPEGKEIFRPNPGFVIKVKDETNKKVFINICSSDKVENMKMNKVNKNGKEGYSTSIPLMVSPVRVENDKKNVPCSTVDVCFNIDVITKCTFSKQILDAVCITAIENAEVRFRQSNEKAKLSRDYHIVKNIKCKGEKPSVFLISV